MSNRNTYVQDGSRELYFACNSSAATTSLISSTNTGFTLTNPFGSGKTLVILQIRACLSAAPAGAAPLVLAANVNPLAAAVVQGTPLVVRSANIGVTKSGVGLAASAATLPATPIVVRPLGGGVVAGSALTPSALVDDVDGALQVAPGCSVSIISVTTASVGFFGIVWEEVSEIS